MGFFHAAPCRNSVVEVNILWQSMISCILPDNHRQISLFERPVVFTTRVVACMY